MDSSIVWLAHTVWRLLYVGSTVASPCSCTAPQSWCPGQATQLLSVILTQTLTPDHSNSLLHPSSPDPESHLSEAISLSRLPPGKPPATESWHWHV